MHGISWAPQSKSCCPSLLANSEKFDKETLFLPLGAAIDFELAFDNVQACFGKDWA